MDVEERTLFAAALRQATETRTGEALDGALVDLGWAEALADDPRTAVATLFELQGERDVTSTALDVVVAAAAGLTPGRLVLPTLGGHAAPATVAGSQVCIRGLCRGAVAGDLRAVVATADGYVAVPVPSDAVQARAVTGMAPALDLVEVAAEVALADAVPTDWPSAVAAAQRAVAHELVGTAQAMLSLARTHAIERIQFGRPIASFQAVRHRLAESLVAVEAARAAADAAWDDPSPTNAALAKAVAGRSARIVARHAQQVLAGIGFTTEHPFHNYLRRALALDGLFGSSRVLTREIGAEVLRSRQLPRPIPL